MNIVDLRADFIRISGRTDLTNAEIDRYVNEGQKFIDRLTEFKHARARHFQIVAAGALGITFSSECRVIQEVWVLDPTGGRTLLAKRDMVTLREDFPTLPNLIDAGRPLYYTPALLRTYPDVLTMAEFTQYLGFFDVLPGTDYEHNGIIFMPPADQEYIIEVFGKFYSTALSDDNTESWWSIHAYSALKHATLRELEVDYRNTEGSNDWEAAIIKDIAPLSMDDAEEEAVGIDSWEIE